MENKSNYELELMRAKKQLILWLGVLFEKQRKKNLNIVINRMFIIKKKG